MTPAVDTRRCEACGESLQDRDPRARVCSHACAVAKLRGQKRGALRNPHLCHHCGERFTPRRSDALYCDGCRRTEPWRRAAPHEICDLLDGPALVRWLKGRFPDFRARLNGELRTVQRWAAGETRATVWALDTVLTALGSPEVGFAGIPSHLWIEDERRAKRAKHICSRCAEHLRRAEPMCGFCIEELRDQDEPLAVAA